MTDPFTPRPEHHFTFGLWTVGNPGRDPFGNEVRAPLDPVDSVHRLADLGAYGVSFHDNDLVPLRLAAATERDEILKRFRRALDATGLHVPMVTTNLFWRPVFKEGAFTANDPRHPSLRRQEGRARRWSSGASSAPSVFVLWGGREGMEAEAAKDVRLALDRYKEAVDLMLRAHRRPGPGPAHRPRTEAERAAGRHPAADRRPRARLHRRPSSGPTWSGSTRSSPTRP